MKLPGKSTHYKNSVIALFPVILSILLSDDCTVLELFRKSGIQSLSDYMSALDCLYALGKIEISEKGEMLHYVG